MNANRMNPYNQYRMTSVQTANPEKLLLMLYDGLVVCLKQAKQAVEEKKMDQAHTSLIQGQDIITELMNTLNMDYDISEGLYKLYDYQRQQLIEANIKKDAEIIDQVLTFTSDLRQTWAQAVDQTKGS
ncbi:MAG: flagellar export chaperone FliS [Syntrophaceticus sp.]|nr:flagellar export chaperone FliS [Syntrophaceticus sp.]MDD4360265.1 flagellar export chaperone FliS [Syntrophaceticus sp.]MDD4783675.1 flagellar export chaperone FliS [Syntrophaceticus sp.]HBG22169.1 flagellar export chaperone FliS [Peptococcaceae bacterium]